jgi:hypothetical protein
VIYAKTKGKTNFRGPLWLNHAVVEELLWAAFHLEHLDGIYLLKSVSWSSNPLPNDTLWLYCDASGTSIGFWYPALNLSF